MSLVWSFLFQFYFFLTRMDNANSLQMLAVHRYLIFENAHLFCVYGKPDKAVDWIDPQGNKIVFSGRKYTRTLTTKTSTLIIHNITEADYGVYICRSALGQEVKTQLNILGKVLNLQKRHTLDVGKPGFVRFTVRGKPEPLIQLWKINQDKDVFMAEWRSKTSENSESRFQIDPRTGINISEVKLSDEGVYQIELGMHGNQAKVGFFLNVTAVPSRILINESTRSIVYIGKRREVLISCVSEGKPLPSLKLSVGKTPVTYNKTVSKNVYKINVTWKYIIYSSEDIQNLVCISSNEVGESNYTIKMEEIKVPSIPRAVQITVKSNKLYIDWIRPEDDGGDKMMQYSVKYCVRSTRICKSTAYHRETLATLSLDYRTTYLIYVSARNRRGTGLPYMVEVDIGSRLPLDIVLPIAIVVVAAILIFGCFFCHFRSKRAKRRRATHSAS